MIRVANILLILSVSLFIYGCFGMQYDLGGISFFAIYYGAPVVLLLTAISGAGLKDQSRKVVRILSSLLLLALAIFTLVALSGGGAQSGVGLFIVSGIAGGLLVLTILLLWVVRLAIYIKNYKALKSDS